MHFRLLIDTPIRPRQKATLAHVHDLRRLIHPQMKRLWDEFPLSECQHWLSHSEILQDRDGQKFAPLISKKAALYCKLDILFLRKGPPGNLIGHGGDIDNRMKTLFDALSVPTKAQVQKLRPDITKDEQPLFSLLQDDALVSDVRVETDRLLTSDELNDLRAIIKVEVFGSKTTWGNLPILTA